MKIIFLDGVDGAGKTSTAYRLLSTKNPNIRYFRSSYQRDSVFAGEPVDLEESIKHDWRILLDFIFQVFRDAIIIVDRGFLSSYVYSLVIRKKNIWKYVEEYIKLCDKFAEYWIFIREDVERMTEEEKMINAEFIKVITKLPSKKIFRRTVSGEVLSADFLNLDEEIRSGRFDTEYYKSKICSVHSVFTRRGLNDKIIVLDIDGTLFNSDASWVSQEINTDVVLMTGRTSIDEDDYVKILALLRPHKFQVILNDRNLGLSSRVLKLFCIGELLKYWPIVVMYDDRADVIEYLKKNLSNGIVDLVERVGNVYKFLVCRR